MNKSSGKGLNLFVDRSRRKVPFFIIAFFILHLNAFSQMNCDEVTLIKSSADNVDLTFDTFSKYVGGITISGSTILKVKVTNSVLNDPANQCRWKLQVVVSNRGGATPVNEWEEVQQYGTSNSNPTIDILKVSARNGCGTPINSGDFDNFIAHGDIISFIENPGTTNPNGACATNVNGPGSYITSFNEYSFYIDYRITPGFSFTPGIYQLALEYKLIEDN